MIWNDKYKTGIEQIDQQHIKWLLITGKALDALLTGSSKDDIVTILKSAIAYTEIHFEYEENLLKKNSYPDLKHHITLHNKMTIYLNKILNEIYKDNYSHLDATKMCDNFMNWLTYHIEQEDKKHIPFIEQVEPITSKLHA